MKSVALVSLVSICCFMILPAESAWASTGLIGGRKVFYAASKDTKLTWWNAQKLCRTLGFELASIESAAESLAITNLLVELVGTQEVFFWTGGSSRGRTANSFVWFSNGRPANYTNWDTNEPNNVNGTENFIHLRQRTVSSAAKYVWNDITETREMSVLCESDIKSLPGVGKPTFVAETNKKVNWYEAVRACAQRGMRLASVESQSELDQFTAAVKASRVGYNDLFWSSGTDMGQTAMSYFWFSTGNPVSFTAWGDRQPNGGSEHCLTVVVPTSGNSSWHDWGCTTEMNYVCETRQL